MAELIKSAFLREFQRNLFSDNSFWRRGKSDSGADQFETINIPEAAARITSTFGPIQGASPTNLANAASLTPKMRINNKRSYNINVFGTDPVALQLQDLNTISYNKRQELFREHQDVIDQDVANFTAIQWAQEQANGDLITLTTGTATRTSIVTGGSAAAVKRIAKNDIINVKRLFHRMNISSIPGSLYALITPEQWEDLLLIDQFVDYDKSGRESKLKEGIVGRLMGIEFLIPRHNAALNANATYIPGTKAKTAYGAALTGAETSAAIFFHSGLVRYARGRGFLYQDRNNPIYKSDIMSADARFGATKSRTDGMGVVSLVEAL